MPSTQIRLTLFSDAFAGGGEGQARVDFYGVYRPDGPVRVGQVRGAYGSGTSGTGPGSGGAGLNFPGKMFDQFGEGAPPMYTTLGVLFPITSYAATSVTGGSTLPYSRGFGSFMDLRFYEADGITPVNVAEVPNSLRVLFARSSSWWERGQG